MTAVAKNFFGPPMQANDSPFGYPLTGGSAPLGGLSLVVSATSDDQTWSLPLTHSSQSLWVRISIAGLTGETFDLKTTSNGAGQDQAVVYTLSTGQLADATALGNGDYILDKRLPVSSLIFNKSAGSETASVAVAWGMVPKA